VQRSIRTALATLLIVLAAPLLTGPARAADVTLHIDAAYVTKTGNGPRAVILIPGLASGAYVFDAIAPSLAKRFTVYTITFAGFDGEPPVQGPYLDAFAKSLVDLIAQEGLRKPVLVGHSLGGYLAVRLAETIPDQIGGVVAVDSLALFPPLRPGDTLAERRTALIPLRDQMLAASDAAFDAQARATTASMVTDPKNVDFITAREIKSDRATFVGSYAEMSVSDLHPQLSKIVAPVLVLAATPTEAQADGYRAFYLQDYAGTPRLDVIAIAPSKHFIMYDQPERFASALDAFLMKVAP
jgi:pimeloyl-ACP methyl ester carboxylesterase